MADNIQNNNSKTAGTQGVTGQSGMNGIQGVIGTQGPQGIQGRKGLQGSQGIIGATGAQGTVGKNGIQGPQGVKGTVGAQGIIGATGAQGTVGKNGIQGPQGVKGTIGVQGIKGCDGTQGTQGKNGTIGLQGLRGNNGIQGLKGCDGAQGTQGKSGTVGLQGLRGNNGAQGLVGIQGEVGIQGVIGLQGKKGNRGEMGYQGEDGEIGIQGLVGEDGAIWEDGIRLKGYNTHLFKFENGKFVSKNTTEDLLYLRNGARINIWLDEDAYEAIMNDGGIKIDKVINGQKEETCLPAYYSEGVSFTDKVNSDIDMNTSVEFIYNEGAWYYDGGLLTHTITTDINVCGVSIGTISDGDVITSGTTIQELFERLLRREVAPKVGSNPKASIAINDQPKIVEVGSAVNATITHSYIDGYFESSDKTSYSDSKFNEINECSGGKLSAGCDIETITFKCNDAVIPSSSITIDSVSEQEYTYKAEIEYSDSTNIPKNNIGEDAIDVKISGSTLSTNIVKVSGCYKMFFGCHGILSESTIEEEHFPDQDSLSILESDWLNSDSQTTIDTIQTTTENPSFAIVVPVGWNIVSTQNSQGQSVQVSTTWYAQNTITYDINGTETEYQVYVSPSTEATTYKNIVLER